jgi:hypothetical protein
LKQSILGSNDKPFDYVCGQLSEKLVLLFFFLLFALFFLALLFFPLFGFCFFFFL